MARVLCISSQTVFGPVGNSAAVPALQALGHEVMQIPTVLLSNHPGLSKPAGQSTSVELIEDMFQSLKAIDAFQNLSGVMTGYFASAAQVIAVAKHITVLKAQYENLHVLVDPVIGDHGRLYVGEDVAEAIRDQLLPLATITTPNIFELKYLTGIEHHIGEAVQSLCIGEVLVTSVPDGDTAIGTQLRFWKDNDVVSHFRTKQIRVPNGTGDYLAGCYLGERLTHLPEHAFRNAMVRLETAIEKSLGLPGLVVN